MKTWFSITVRMVCLVESRGIVDTWDQTFLIAGRTRKDAFKTSLKIGKGLEQEYKNKFGQKVRWRCSEILQLTPLGKKLKSGMEVYWEPKKIKQKFSFSKKFYPKKSKPESIELE